MTHQRNRQASGSLRFHALSIKLNYCTARMKKNKEMSIEEAEAEGLKGLHMRAAKLSSFRADGGHNVV